MGTPDDQIASIRVITKLRLELRLKLQSYNQLGNKIDGIIKLSNKKSNKNVFPLHSLTWRSDPPPPGGGPPSTPPPPQLFLHASFLRITRGLHIYYYIGIPLPTWRGPPSRSRAQKDPPRCFLIGIGSPKWQARGTRGAWGGACRNLRGAGGCTEPTP